MFLDAENRAAYRGKDGLFEERPVPHANFLAEVHVVAFLDKDISLRGPGVLDGQVDDAWRGGFLQRPMRKEVFDFANGFGFSNHWINLFLVHRKLYFLGKLVTR